MGSFTFTPSTSDPTARSCTETEHFSKHSGADQQRVLHKDTRHAAYPLTCGSRVKRYKCSVFDEGIGADLFSFAELLHVV